MLAFSVDFRVFFTIFARIFEINGMNSYFAITLYSINRRTFQLNLEFKIDS